MTQFKIGIAPINWCNDDDPSLGADISFEQCIKEMAETGYNGCEIGHKFPKQSSLLKQQLQPLNLQISSSWFSSYFTEEDKFEETLEHFLEHISFLTHMGARFVNVCECGHSIQSSELALFGELRPSFNQAQWQRLIQGVHILGRICHDYGMQLVYHHHLGTGIEHLDQIEYLMAHTSPELVGLLLDTGHAYAAGMEPKVLLDNFADRIRYIHLKDIRQEVLIQAKLQQWDFMQAVKAGVFTVPGDGAIDFSLFFKRLKEINYHGWLIVEAEQDPIKANPKHYAKLARDFLYEQLGC